MSYLITGGTGLIGAYISTQLLTKEREAVIIFDIDPREGILEHLMSKEEIALIKVIKGDVTDLAHLIHTAKEHNITKIIHMAGLLNAASSANPTLAVQINCYGMANILETARILDVKKVVYASTIAVFGPAEKYQEAYIADDAPHYPSTLYAACKSFNERLAEHYFTGYGVDSVGLRFPVVYGMGYRGGASSTITQELMVKPTLGKPGRVPFGDDTLHWLYVEDAARAVVMTSKKQTTKTKVFNVNGEICRVAQAVDYVRKLVHDAEITLLPGHTGFTAKYEASQIREEIGYQPKWSLEQGIEQVINAVRRLHNLEKRS